MYRLQSAQLLLGTVNWDFGLGLNKITKKSTKMGCFWNNIRIFKRHDHMILISNGINSQEMLYIKVMIME